MMKRLVTFCAAVLFLSKTDAQLFNKKDSIRQSPIIQIGVGFTSGIHQYKPLTGAFTFDNAAGYDYCYFGRVQVNILQNFSIATDLRYAKRSGTINIMNDVIQNFFYLQASGIQTPIIFQYTIKSKRNIEVISIHSGYAFNTSLFKTQSDYFTSNQPFYATAIGAELVNGRKERWASYIVGLSKSFDILSRFNVTAFIEAEKALDSFTLDNSFTSKSTLKRESHIATFESNAIRMGFLINIKL